MRVLEPPYFQQHKRRRRRSVISQRPLVVGGSIILILVSAYVVFGQTTTEKPQTHHDNPTDTAALTTTRQLKTFSSEEFKNAYSSYIYPNTQPITKPPEITGDEEADARIRRVAEARGYKLTAVPVSNIIKTGEPGLVDDDLMQPNAQVAWTQLKEAAVGDGVTLKLTSAYRSIDYQRALFLRRMQNAGVNIFTILDGHADDELDFVLSRAAIPGYSRHHTGFTIDLSCNGIGLDAFRTTKCYKWLSKNNFEQAKTYGWVPSYPEGVGKSGPEPESWEYIWIGTARTYQ